MSLRFHEISEADHRILNPITETELMLLGEICQLGAGSRHLDLASGKGEMLCQWSRQWGSGGVGVDISKVFLAAARARAAEFGLEAKVRFDEGDAGHYQGDGEHFDLVSCIGATWIGGGLTGTLGLMKPFLKPGGLMLVGEPFWSATPPEKAYESSGIGRDATLVGTLDRVESCGMGLVEMVLANPNTWDRYVAAQWLTVDNWLRANPTDPEADALRGWITRSRRNYLEYERPGLGWGVFVLRVT